MMSPQVAKIPFMHIYFCFCGVYAVKVDYKHDLYHMSMVENREQTGTSL